MKKLIRLNSNFENNSPTYLDCRECVKNLSELKVINLTVIPTGFIVYVESENCRYEYLPTNANNSIGGKWRKVLCEEKIKNDENIQIKLNTVKNNLLNI